MDQQLADRLAIRDVIETWAIARDSGDWETFRGTWHDDGYMMATWFRGPAGKFIEVSRDGWQHGVSILHFLGGGRITVAGKRAIAQTKMTIMQRGAVHDVLCDVTCTAVLRLPGTPRRPLGDCAPPADLRDGPHRPR